MQTKNTKQGGFTLVEIAIVLVIIGLLLGGILKGQELINNAKVRSVADRQNSLKAAWFGFIDRYNFIPGDSKRAKQLVPGALARTSGTLESEAGDGFIAVGESVLAMQELTGAGFLRCPQCTSALDLERPTAENSLINQYSGVMSIWHDSNFYSERLRGGGSRDTTATANGRLQIHSGPRIPSNILGEVDRKIDDGIANSGDMVYNYYDPSIHNLTTDAHGGGVGTQTTGQNWEECTNIVVDFVYSDVGTQYSGSENVWRTLDRDPAVENNCGASVFI